jgi:hypothetical protein
MQASSMQRLSQFLSSSLLIFFGMIVATASLTSLHAKQTFASQGDFSSLETSFDAGARMGQLMNKELPGSLPYVFARGVDKVTLLLDAPDDELAHLLGFVHERAHSARLAAELGKESESLVTFSKAVAYYHRSLAACKEYSGCAEHKEAFLAAKIDLLDTSGSLTELSSSAEIRAKFQGFSGELETLPEPAF